MAAILRGKRLFQVICSLSRLNKVRKKRLGRCRKPVRVKKSKRQARNSSGRHNGVAQEEERVIAFRAWCSSAGIHLHPKLFIGRKGSCADIGVVATDRIAAGEELAVIPRSALLTASTGVATSAIASDSELLDQLEGNSSWVPLLLTLIAEYAQKGSSHWQPYLDLVPNNKECGPPLLWSKGDRERLLSGMGVDQLVKRDLELIANDYHLIAQPFMHRHPEVYSKGFVSQQLYEQATAFVMSYSFTDVVEPAIRTALSAHSQTMMVPFVDLLNHHSSHHAELIFQPDCLRLVAVKPISKGEEVMNTYGELPNYTLLHVYGFVLQDNPCDAVCVDKIALRSAYLLEEEGEESVRRRKRWKKLERRGLIPDGVELSCGGEVDPELLTAVRLLFATPKHLQQQLCSGNESLEEESFLLPHSLGDMTAQELAFIKRLTGLCIKNLPEDMQSCQQTAALRWRLLNEKEQSALQLCIAQHKCLREWTGPQLD